MQIPFWLLLTSLFLALTSREIIGMASLLSRVGPAAVVGGIRRSAPLLPYFLTNLNNYKYQPTSIPQQSSFSTTTTKMSGSKEFLTLLKNRRTHYALSKSSPISDAAIQDIVKQCVLHVPSSFNSQSTRVVLLLKAEHDKLWEIVKETIKAVVPAEAWPQSEQKLNGFKAGYGTVRSPPTPSPFPTLEIQC